MRVEVAEDGSTTPPEVFVVIGESLGVNYPWDVAPDGESVIAAEPRPPARMHLVVNWFEELKRLVPPVDASTSRDRYPVGTRRSSSSILLTMTWSSVTSPPMLAALIWSRGENLCSP